MARLSSMTPPVLLKVPGALEGLFVVPNLRSSAKSQQRISGLDVAQPVVNAFRDRSSAYDAGVVKTNRVSYAKTCVATKLARASSIQLSVPTVNGVDVKCSRSTTRRMAA